MDFFGISGELLCGFLCEQGQAIGLEVTELLQEYDIMRPIINY